MDLRELVQALLQRDALRAREILRDSLADGTDWSAVEEPGGLDPTERALAAGVVELLAERGHALPPRWTASVPAAPTQLFLVRFAETMPRLRRSCLEEGPWPLRRRGLLAPPGFLTQA